MTRGQEILLGLGILIGTPIAYPFIYNEIWLGFLKDNVEQAMPTHTSWAEAWGDLFMAGAPIGILLVAMAFGVLLLIGKMHSKDDRNIER